MNPHTLTGPHRRSLAAWLLAVLAPVWTGTSPAAEFNVPSVAHPTLQDAIDAAAANAEAENFINLRTERLDLHGEVAIVGGFRAGHALVIRPDPAIVALRRVTLANDNGFQPILRIDSAGAVTIQDLDLIRHTTNRRNLVDIRHGTNVVVERCRVGSDWPVAGDAGYANIYLEDAQPVVVRNTICFAYAAGTLDAGIRVDTPTAMNNSVYLYNNTVADHRLFGIDIKARGDSVLVLRNNVVLNRPGVEPEPFAYRADVELLVQVITSHNTAFAAAANLELQVLNPGKGIAGIDGLLLLPRAAAGGSFLSTLWIVNPAWHPNPDFHRLHDGGPLHNLDTDAGISVSNNVPHEKDLAVTDDWEKHPRPSGVALRTDRGADQVAQLVLRDIALDFPGLQAFLGASRGDDVASVLEIVAVGPQEDLPVIQTTTMTGGEFSLSGQFVSLVGEHSVSYPPGDKLHLLPLANLEVRLDRLLYGAQDTIAPELFVHAGQLSGADLGLVLVAPQSRDLEVVTVRSSPDGRRYAADQPLPITAFTVPGAVAKFNGTLTLQPGEVFFAVFLPNAARDHGAWQGEEYITDFGILRDGSFGAFAPEILPALAMTEDEITPPPGGKQIGTIMYPGGLPVQIPVNELIIQPRSQAELDRFLAETAGQVIMTDVLLQERTSGRVAKRFLVRVNPNLGQVPDLPQMESLLGTRRKLLASSEAALRICALALRYKLEGLLVGVNPRLQFMDRPTWRDNPMRDEIGGGSSSFKHRLFNMPKTWSYLALWDADTRTVPVAFLDQGFSPNADFRAPLAECDMEGGSLVDGLFMDFRCEAGAAVSPPTTGNGFFGDKSWHGNMVVTVAGGIVNNGYGAAGTGGQVVAPMLYRFGAASYVFETGLGIRKAVLDGAAVINISAGYPCVIVADFGPDYEICGIAGRAAFCLWVTTELEAAAALICADAGLLGLIPVVGGFLAAETCGAAQLAAAAGSTACLTTLLAGDLRDPMEEAVAFALERGVPIVASAGNPVDEENLPPVLLDFVDTENHSVDDWQTIPAVIPGVICAGSAKGTNWANADFFGARVDVWAPVPSHYFHPTNIDQVEPDPSRQIDDTGGGTSAAAPYLAGLIADMMALNPVLNPLTPGLTDNMRRDIPRRVRDLLVTTAYTAEELEADDYLDPTGRRRNLVNPLAALREAARFALPDFVALGYDNSVDFGESDDANSHDLPEFATDLGTVGAGATRTGTILGLPALPPSGEAHTDVDWFSFNLPWAGEQVVEEVPDGQITHEFRDGLYEVVVQLVTPSVNPFGRLGLSGRGFGFRGGPLPGPGPDESTVEYTSGPLFPGAAGRQFQVGEGMPGDDNVYKMLVQPPRRLGDRPDGDRFDQNNPAINPAQSRPDNDTRLRAVPLGTTNILGGEFAWQTVFDASGQVPLYSRIVITNLSFHSAADEDWFETTVIPPYEFYRHEACKPRLLIAWSTGGLEVQVVNRNGEPLYHNSRSPADIPSMYIGEGVRFVLRPWFPGEYIQYDLTLEFHAPTDDLCDLENRFGGQHGSEGGLIRDVRTAEYARFPSFYPLVTDATELARRMREPREVVRDMDANGRIVTPDLYLLTWDGRPHFQLALEVVEGTEIRVSLMDTLGNVLATASTAAGLRSQALSTGPVDALGRPYALLEVATLPAGDYLLAVSHGLPNTLLRWFLPEGVAPPDAVTAAQFVAHYLPLPVGVPEATPPAAVRLSQVQWRADELTFVFPTEIGVSYRVEYSDALPSTVWPTLARVDGTGGWLRVRHPLRAGHRFYRVVAD